MSKKYFNIKITKVKKLMMKLSNRDMMAIISNPREDICFGKRMPKLCNERNGNWCGKNVDMLCKEVTKITKTKEKIFQTIYLNSGLNKSGTKIIDKKKWEKTQNGN